MDIRVIGKLECKVFLVADSEYHSDFHVISFHGRVYTYIDTRLGCELDIRLIYGRNEMYCPTLIKMILSVPCQMGICIVIHLDFHARHLVRPYS